MTAKKILITCPPRNGSARKWLIAAVVIATIVVFALILPLQLLPSGQGNVALIRVSGSISSSSDSFFEKPASPDEIIGMIEQAEKAAAVKGILMEINSPGGSPVASEELMKAVKNAGKPTVAVIRDIGTSGAYWVASASDHVIASPVSLTGSVGVTASYLEFSQLLQDYGVRYERLVSAEHKDVGSPFRNLTGEEREIAEAALAKMHSYFLGSVVENRQLTDKAAIGRVSTAMVFLGSEAKELGLVDGLGGKKEAEEWLMQQANLTEVKYATYEKKPLFSLGALLAQQSSYAGSAFGKSLAAAVFGAGAVQNART